MTNRTKLNTLEGEMKQKEWTPAEINAFRLKLKLTQLEFGNLTGTTNRYICMLERGQKKPGPMLKLLLDCLERQGKAKKGRR